jgi:hypothetical protein
MFSYRHWSSLRFLEELLAESNAQRRVHGVTAKALAGVRSFNWASYDLSLLPSRSKRYGWQLGAAPELLVMGGVPAAAYRAGTAAIDRAFRDTAP